MWERERQKRNNIPVQCPETDNEWSFLTDIAVLSPSTPALDDHGAHSKSEKILLDWWCVRLWCVFSAIKSRTRFIAKEDGNLLSAVSRRRRFLSWCRRRHSYVLYIYVNVLFRRKISCGNAFSRMTVFFPIQIRFAGTDGDYRTSGYPWVG